MSRRSVVVAGAAGLLGAGAFSRALAQATFRADQSEGNVLVVVFLRGGADGLNIVSPYAEDEYYRLRPTLGLAAPRDTRIAAGQRLIDLDGFFGLNPALAKLAPQFLEGRMAFVQACGSGDPTRSHFEAMAIMERGLFDESTSEQSGWLARHLRAAPRQGSPLRAVAIGGLLPDALGGSTEAVAIRSLADYRLSLEDPDRRDQALAALGRLYGVSRDEASVAGQATLKVLKSLEKALAEGTGAGKAAYPDTDLGRALRETAFLIRQNLGLEIACVDAGGYDTHVTQGTTDGWLFNLLKDLGDGLAAFLGDLGSNTSRVTVVVQSEFGRRLEENSGFGTDHGHGGVMMALGAGVRGGKVYGQWPGLAPEHRTGPGDLKSTSDYRDVLGEILDQRLNSPDLRAVFPHHQVRPLGIVSSA